MTATSLNVSAPVNFFLEKVYDIENFAIIEILYQHSHSFHQPKATV